jgi:hypothetical protein
MTADNDDWPVQPRPHDKVCWGSLWRTALSKSVCNNLNRYVLVSRPGILKDPLGPWNRDSDTHSNPRPPTSPGLMFFYSSRPCCVCLLGPFTRNGKVRDCAKNSGISLVIPDLPVFPSVIPDLHVIPDFRSGISLFSLQCRTFWAPSLFSYVFSFTPGFLCSECPSPPST